MQTIDGLDRQIKTGTTAEDLLSVDMGRIHPLTGPVHVEGAEPGDLLAVKIEAVDTADRGFTMIMPGFGFLREHFTQPYLVHWEMSGGFAYSRELPGVRIPGAPFMGVMGVAPSHELLARTNTREAELLGRGGAVVPPSVGSAVPADPAIAASALRTFAPHETGGNVDIKQLTVGATLYLPVYQPGALFSVGDAHFAQGDGESCGTAVETSATFVATFELMKGEARRRNQRDPSFEHPGYFTSPEMAAPRRFYATTGTSISRDGLRNESESLTMAAQNALLNMIEYLVDTRGFTREQAYCLISVAVDLKVSQVVDVPNLIVSAFLPLEIFSG
jgi:formamidase